MRCRAAQLGMSSHPPAHHIYVQAAPLWPGEVSATWTSYTAGKHANIWWMRCYGTVIQWYTMILYILYIFCNDSTLYVEFPSCNVSSLSSKQFRRRVQPSHPTPGNRAREYTRGHYKTTWLYIRIYRYIYIYIHTYIHCVYIYIYIIIYVLYYISPIYIYRVMISVLMHIGIRTALMHSWPWVLWIMFSGAKADVLHHSQELVALQPD